MSGKWRFVGYISIMAFSLEERAAPKVRLFLLGHREVGEMITAIYFWAAPSSFADVVLDILTMPLHKAKIYSILSINPIKLSAAVLPVLLGNRIVEIGL